LLNETLEALALKDNGIYVDATIGEGGHALGILQRVPSCKLIGIDRDEEAIKAVQQRLQGYDVHLFQEPFSKLKTIVQSLRIDAVDGIVIDPGLSNIHLRSEGRGFSFMKDDPLDMRMDNRQDLTAWHVVNQYSEKELAQVLWEYGEERHARGIARAVVAARKTQPIKTCRDLVRIVETKARKTGRIHVATKTFQAIRIEVNKELDELKKAIVEGSAILGPSGRFCILSYHSLEDRIVKHTFKALQQDGLIQVITKKPVRATIEEIRRNPSARSAKLRIGEKIS
jgi:16S rRNA (cytosine1402-N4)-methyltransferase